MCRIAGIISDKLPGAPQLLKQMCNAMAHGGPDDEGFYLNEALNIYLGHRRLSIIDLSSGGHQPMFNDAQNLVITFNGEIYNYLQIKEELIALGCKFNTASDTEVILQAYKTWGTDSFKRFNGMFAFGLFDLEHKDFYLVRDALGIKPLYYSIAKNQLVFSSEIKGLKQLQIFEENPDWKLYFLAFGHMPEPFTTLKDVHSLPKGHFLCYNLQSKKEVTTSYRSFELQEKEASSITSLKEKLDKAIERHLISDAPIGVFLSGGVDSSILTLAAANITHKNLQSISTYFHEPGFSERKYQQIIRDLIKGNHHEFDLTFKDFEASFSKAFSAMDQPSADGINSWFICRAANRAGLKAVLSGIGADEFFGGYPSFRRMKKLKFLRKMKSISQLLAPVLGNEKAKRFNFLNIDGPVGDYLFLRGMFAPKEIAGLLNIPEGVIFEKLKNLNKFYQEKQYKKLSDGNKAGFLESNFYMQNQLLRDSDAMSMSHSIELRVPFLDQDLIDYIRKVKADDKFDHKELPKHLLIKAFIHSLPEAIWNRPKMGFSLPFQQWMIKSAQFKLPGSAGEKSLKLMQQFKNNNLHWSKAFALYHVFSKA